MKSDERMAIRIFNTVREAYNKFYGNRTLLAIGVVMALITTAMSFAFGLISTNFTSNINNNPSAAIALFMSPTFWIELVAATAAVTLVGLFMAGTLMSAVAEGDKATIGGALRSAASRYISLVGASAVLCVLDVLACIPMALALGLLIISSHGSGIALTLIAAILCIILAIIPLYVTLRLSLSEMVCVVGGKRAIASIKGSWAMLKGNLWQILGISFCIGIIEMVAGMLITFIINPQLGTFVELLLGYPLTVAYVLVYLQLSGRAQRAAKK